MLSVKTIRISIGTLAVALALVSTQAVQGQFGGGRPGMGGMGGGGAPGPAPQKPKRYTPKRFAPSGPRINVAEVRITGKYTASESRIRSKLQTRQGRQYDPAAVLSDKRQLLSTGLCYDVRTYREDTPAGVIITFELFEQPTLQRIEFVGNKVRKKTLLKECELTVGQPLSRYRVEEARRKLVEYYQGRGNSFVEIAIQEGDKEGDRAVVFSIQEGPRQRIRWTKFEGNKIASDARLRTQIDSKPGFLWLFKGQVDRDVIDEDVDKLTSYYRSLGFFQAQIEKKFQFDPQEEWLTLTFQINEGPRYTIRSISLEGNEVYAQNDLLATTAMRPGDFFDLTRMNADVKSLKDAYGANGYIKCQVRATPQFDEEPGHLDLVYKIDEGRQHRVGRIIVNLDGEYPHTRESVIRNRIALAEGDIIDINKLKAAERRLTSSQLFENGPFGGPEIAVQPHDPGTRTANRAGRSY